MRSDGDHRIFSGEAVACRMAVSDSPRRRMLSHGEEVGTLGQGRSNAQVTPEGFSWNIKFCSHGRRPSITQLNVLRAE